MNIITLECSNCNTIVAGNVLVEKRVMKCPGLSCENVMKFTDFNESEQISLQNG